MERWVHGVHTADKEDQKEEKTDLVILRLRYRELQ